MKSDFSFDPLVIAVWGMAAALSGLLGLPVWYSGLLTYSFLLFCPGMALIRYLPIPETLFRVPLSIALSLVVNTLVALGMAWIPVWSPQLAFTFIFGFSLLAAYSYDAFLADPDARPLRLLRRASWQPLQMLDKDHPETFAQALPIPGRTAARSGSNRRRSFSGTDRLLIVIEGLAGEISITDLCQREGITTRQYYRWKRSVLDSGLAALYFNRRDPAEADLLSELERENEQLKRALDDLRGKNLAVYERVFGKPDPEPDDPAKD